MNDSNFPITKKIKYGKLDLTNEINKDIDPIFEFSPLQAVQDVHQQEQRLLPLSDGGRFLSQAQQVLRHQYK